MVSIESLRGCELFWELDDAGLAEIAALCREESYPAGATVFSEAEAAEDLYILQEGRVALQIQLRSMAQVSGEVTIEEVEPGHVFGWSALVRQRRLTASARCLEDVRVVAVKGRALNELFERNAHIGFVVMKRLADVISSRLRITRERLAERSQTPGEPSAAQS
ncbi:MAG: Crp/Fnr family transcriptional regulator [Anaerolineae bacterium]